MSCNGGIHLRAERDPEGERARPVMVPRHELEGCRQRGGLDLLHERAGATQMHVLLVGAVVQPPARMVAVMQCGRGRPGPVMGLGKTPHVVEPDRLRFRRHAHARCYLVALHPFSGRVAHELAGFLRRDVARVVQAVVAHRAPFPVVEHLQAAHGVGRTVSQAQLAVHRARRILVARPRSRAVACVVGEAHLHPERLALVGLDQRVAAPRRARDRGFRAGVHPVPLVSVGKAGVAVLRLRVAVRV